LLQKSAPLLRISPSTSSQSDRIWRALAGTVLSTTTSGSIRSARLLHIALFKVHSLGRIVFNEHSLTPYCRRQQADPSTLHVCYIALFSSRCQTEISCSKSERWHRPAIKTTSGPVLLACLLQHPAAAASKFSPLRTNRDLSSSSTPLGSLALYCFCDSEQIRSLGSSATTLYYSCIHTVECA
jgi:hypothetical protein